MAVLIVDRARQDRCLSVLKVPLGCSRILGVDSTAFEHAFPGMKQTVPTSHKRL